MDEIIRFTTFLEKKPRPEFEGREIDFEIHVCEAKPRGRALSLTNTGWTKKSQGRFFKNILDGDKYVDLNSS